MKRHLHSWLGLRVLVLAAVVAALASPLQASELADAAQQRNLAAVKSLLKRGASVDEQQVDGATALLWAVQWDDLDMAKALVAAHADPVHANRTGASPLQLAAINGDPAMLTLLLKAGANPSQKLSASGDTPLMMAARTGVPAAVQVLLDAGTEVNVAESWNGTTALMWAATEGHADVVRQLIKAGAKLDVQSQFVGTDKARGFEGVMPRARHRDEVGGVYHASGEMTALMFAAREGHLDTAKALVEAGADLNKLAGDGKDALSLALFNGNYAIASYLIDHGSKVNQADARGFNPLFWAVDRRNMETAPNFPWVVTEDPLPLVKKLLDAGANPNQLVNDTPQARMRGGSPRIVFATPLMRAAFSADLELVKLLLSHGADPSIKSKDNETALSAAAGLGFIHGFHKLRPYSERLEVIKLLVQLGGDVNWQDNYGISPLMVAGNLGDVAIIQYLIDHGADLGAYDLGKKNDGMFGASIEPLMPIDYAIGVGTFRPNNAIVFNEAAVMLMQKEMDKRGIKHTTSECTLRGFTCSSANMDPRAATPLTIEKARAMQIGYQVTDTKTGKGLQVEEPAKK
ncbi:MAG TPA: ankyrin repeat domain-containing protein [Candidatus Acidoferrum sp.]|nr:ankyrin repeat domain-containing protein [Candidatus Acidoferrum sp.]